jgi:hypothetical protein
MPKRLPEDLNARIEAEIARHREGIGNEAAVRSTATNLVPSEDLERIVELALDDLRNLHEGNVSRYRLRLSEYRAWKPLQQAVMP